MSFPGENLFPPKRPFWAIFRRVRPNLEDLTSFPGENMFPPDSPLSCHSSDEVEGCLQEHEGQTLGVDLAVGAHLDAVHLPKADAMFNSAAALELRKLVEDAAAVGQEPGVLADGGRSAWADQPCPALVEGHGRHAVLLKDGFDACMIPQGRPIWVLNNKGVLHCQLVLAAGQRKVQQGLALEAPDLLRSL